MPTMISKRFLMLMLLQACNAFVLQPARRATLSGLTKLHDVEGDKELDPEEKEKLIMKVRGISKIKRTSVDVKVGDKEMVEKEDKVKGRIGDNEEDEEIFGIQELPAISPLISEAFPIEEEFIHYPSSEFSSEQVLSMCLDALKENGRPYKNAGVEVCWNFLTDMGRASQGGSMERFMDYSYNPVFSTMVDCQDWSIKTKGTLVKKTLHRGPMRSYRVSVTSLEGREREFLFILQKERRPPKQDCWLIHQCMTMEGLYAQTL